MAQDLHQKLQNKIVVVTGGNSGIGLGAARAFRAQGASVVIAGRDEKTLFDAARELGGDTLAVRADVADLRDIDALYAKVKERFGRIDVLFANAGVGGFQPAHDVDEKAFDQLADINFKGLFFTVTKASSLLARGASVVLTSSVLHEMGRPGSAVYSATKAAVRSIGRTLAAEWAPRGIRVNTLSPGPIETPIFERAGFDAAAKQKFIEQTKASNPMGRFGTMEEMGKVAVFLASDDSSYITGADLKAGGGVGEFNN